MVRLLKKCYSSQKKSNPFGLTVSKKENFSEWYRQVLIKSELIDYTDISGCYVLRPYGYAIWNQIQSYLREALSKRGVNDAYFPLFISESALKKESQHIEGFSPEVAWVTKAGSQELSVNLAVRPTSETAIYPLFSRWIQTKRNLPLKINQWCNVVRWEFNNPTPLIRSREFLWQEGHTAYARKEEADEEVFDIIKLYEKVYRDFLGVGITAGIKSRNEKFAGAEFTATVEAFIEEEGKAVQGATSHSLGQNFSKIFNIRFEDHGKSEFVWQNSWGFTTRSVGVLVMAHGDDKGLILPPYVAPVQIIIIPVGIKANLDSEILESLKSACLNLEKTLIDAGFRVKCDLDDHETAGWKFNEYELKGIPLRITIGPKELKDSFSSLLTRDGVEYKIKIDENYSENIKAILKNMQIRQIGRAHV